MQRTALCLVAVLVLLAGCSGGMGGGSDETPTPAASPTQTPEPTPLPEINTSTGSDDASHPATTRLSNVGLNDSRVLQGERVRINATVENLNDTVANQTVTLHAGSEIVYTTSVELRPKETRTVNLITLNTSAVEPGEQFVSVSTANDTGTTRLNVEPREPLREYISDVRERTRVLQSGKIVGPDHVKLEFNTHEDYTQLYVNSDVKPVPEAAALEMANGSYAPEKVTLTLTGGSNFSRPMWESTLTASQARQYANGSLLPSELRARLSVNATGQEAAYDLHNFEERFFFPGGDRARRAYAKGLAQRLNNSNAAPNITVHDYGLYNGTVDLPDTWRTLGPNASVYVEFQVSEEDRDRRYRGFNSTERGVRTFETIFKWGNITLTKEQGERPASVRIRYVDPEGELLATADIPTMLAIKGSGGGLDGVESAFIEIAFSPLYKHYP